MVQKKVRVRRAATTSGHAVAAGTSVGSSAKPSKLAAVKTKLPKPGIFRVLRVLLRPLRWLTPSYFVNSWREVRQVTWPNRRETWRLTLAVFIFAVVFGALVAGVDKGLDLLFKKVILRQ